MHEILRGADHFISSFIAYILRWFIKLVEFNIDHEYVRDGQGHIMSFFMFYVMEDRKIAYDGVISLDWVNAMYMVNFVAP